MKSLFASTTAHGALWSAVFFALSMAGIHLDRDQTLGIYDELKIMAPAALGILAAITTLYHRVQQIHFDAAWFTSPAFASAAVTAGLAVAHMFNMPTADLATLPAQVGHLAGQFGPVLTGAVMIVGSVTASKPIQIRRALPVD